MSVLMDRWQFGVTIVYHFLFVPLTIGLGLLVAVMQSLAYRRHDEEWDRLARFFGRLFLINFAMGVVTGIVQEFQFGMNWSNYSVFVGNIFGAPLAIEGLLAFFMESTFLGLWIFGRNRLPPVIHLATIWLASLGTILSALFILAANAWMQHPVGYRVVGHKAVLTDFWAVLANTTLWESFFHTVLAAFLTGGMFLLGISVWKLIRQGDRAFFRPVKLAAAFSLVCVLGVMVTGDTQARLMDEQQPMKMAAAEALFNTEEGASFSLLTIGNLSGQPIFQIRIPHLLSLISTVSWNGKVQGINQVQEAEEARFGPGNYIPIIWVTYWSFRIMVGLGILILILSGWALILSRRKEGLEETRLPRWFSWVALAGVAMPFLANTAGWIFTEMGRQPWIVFGLMRTSEASSPTVTIASVAVTFAGFVLLYTALGLIDVILMTRSARRPLSGDEEGEEEGEGDEGEDRYGSAGAALIY